VFQAASEVPSGTSFGQTHKIEPPEEGYETQLAGTQLYETHQTVTEEPSGNNCTPPTVTTPDSVGHLPLILEGEAVPAEIHTSWNDVIKDRKQVSSRGGRRLKIKQSASLARSLVNSLNGPSAQPETVEHAPLMLEGRAGPAEALPGTMSSRIRNSRQP